MKRKKLFASIATFALSIALMMFGVYAAANPSVKLSGQISYQVYDAKVLARGRVENAKTYDGSADVNAATYPTVNADYKTSTKVNTQSQYLDYTIGDEKGDSTDNFTTWTFGDIAFNENNVNPIKMYLEFTNYSLYDIVATITFEKTEQELTTGNLKRTVSETEVVIAGFNQTATSKEILIEYDVLNRGTKVNKFNVNASITIEQYFDEGGNGGGSQTPTNPPNATLEGWTYTDNGDGTIQLTAYNGSKTEIVVPTILDGKTVTGIVGYYDGQSQPLSVFANAPDVTSVTLPSTLETIGGFAFVMMENLQSLIVPEGVKSLGMGAIAMCPQLNELILPSTLETIVDMAFVDNSSMTQIFVMAEFPPALGEEVFASSALTTVYVPKESYEAYSNHEVWGLYDIVTVNTYEGWIYYGHAEKDGVVIIKYTGSETEIVVPTELPVDGVNKTVVGLEGKENSSVFANARNITALTIPANIEYIGDFAFYGCTLLNEIKLLSNEVPTLGENVFVSHYENSDYYQRYVNNYTIIYVQDSMVDTFKADETWKSLTHILPISDFEENIVEGLSSGDWQYCYYPGKDGVAITKYTGSTSNTVEIPNVLPVEGQDKKVIGVLDFAFYDCGDVWVTFPQTIEFIIGNYIFTDDQSVYNAFAFDSVNCPIIAGGMKIVGARNNGFPNFEWMSTHNPPTNPEYTNTGYEIAYDFGERFHIQPY